MKTVASGKLLNVMRPRLILRT
ncbi:hypothetical protein Godav_014311 [Gossypium davidsonii]|uniref:Uncharacterized protein n=2 Tax=Gossypium TaxID=3633 RepID=A0A7J8RJP9_GOSDV|nr:hypothetical protein [Gossypium davidsonii]MBA0649163.1 hypothetical protein [Gossypium klotzschianum]